MADYGYGSSPVKLTVVLTEEDLANLERQSQVDRIPKSDCIRRSLQIGQVAWEAQRRGAQLTIRERDGQLRPVQLGAVQSGTPEPR
jgi:hypothetical protein